LEDNKIIDGKSVSNRILLELKQKVRDTGITPGLAFFLLGNNPASEVYVRMKSKTCEELGYYSILEKLPESTSENELLGKIETYNKNPKIHGILVQLPLPRHVEERRILEAVDYHKDVDGLHPINAGRLVIGEKCFIPCTPAGIIELLKSYKIEMKGKNVVVLGRSNLVGKPIANLLLQKTEHANATVTICHTATKDISNYTRQADVIIAAMGKAKFVTKDMIKEGVVLIDVGTTKIEDKTKKSGSTLVGDVNFEDCYEKASKITPVPGGVGPMTIAMLMKNTLDSATKAIYP
jgi:methylenetetrahydrofolate dehydrogenase (NADP+)/methenyltetrahydrofolate cyclohydrolase